MSGESLRHIHETTLLLAGVPVHAEAAITRGYAHVIHEQAATAADIFAKAVKDGGRVSKLGARSGTD